MMYTLEELKQIVDKLDPPTHILSAQDLIEYIESLEKEALETAKSDQYDLETCHNV